MAAGLALCLLFLFLGGAALWSARQAVSANNYGLNFDGNNSTVTGPIYPNSNGTQTMEVWVKPASNNAYGIVLDTRNNDDNQGWIIELRNSQAEFWVAGPDNIDRFLLHTGVTMLAGQWYPIAATYNASSHLAQLFVNGEPSNTADLGTLTVGPLVRMGRFGAFASFKGLADEVRVSNIILVSTP